MKKLQSTLLCLALILSLTACAAEEFSAPSEDAPPSGESVASSGDSSAGTSDSADASSSAGDSDETADAAQEAPSLLSSFSTTDLEGNAVDQSILEGYDLTLVNVWATFCGPCLSEMPDLGKLSAEYAEKGVQILGLVSDTLGSDGSIDPNQVELAQEIVEETGADYLHLLPSSDLYGLLGQIYGVPTTFFVDSEGTQVGYAYVTAMSYDQFVEIIDTALAEVTA